MDDQHGILMDVLNELRLALVRGSGREQVNEVLSRLIDFTRMHFRSEEQLMRQTGFPGLADHLVQHQSLLRLFREWAQRAQLGEELHTHSLLGSLRDGYMTHIGGCDQLYGPWMNERGVD
jgi:hemerythrin-like metal-binding protein